VGSRTRVERLLFREVAAIKAERADRERAAIDAAFVKETDPDWAAGTMTATLAKSSDVPSTAIAVPSALAATIASMAAVGSVAGRSVHSAMRQRGVVLSTSHPLPVMGASFGRGSTSAPAGAEVLHVLASTTALPPPPPLGSTRLTAAPGLLGASGGTSSLGITHTSHASSASGGSPSATVRAPRDSHAVKAEVLRKTGVRVKGHDSGALVRKLQARLAGEEAHAAAVTAGDSTTARDSRAVSPAPPTPQHAGGSTATLAASGGAGATAGGQTAGMLGEWDKYRVHSTFKAMDSSGRGWMSARELALAFDACADLGFVAVPPAEFAALSSALAATAASPQPTSAPHAGGRRASADLRRGSLMSTALSPRRLNEKQAWQGFLAHVIATVDPVRCDRIRWSLLLDGLQTGVFARGAIIDAAPLTIAAAVTASSTAGAGGGGSAATATAAAGGSAAVGKSASGTKGSAVAAGKATGSAASASSLASPRGAGGSSSASTFGPGGSVSGGGVPSISGAGPGSPTPALTGMGKLPTVTWRALSATEAADRADRHFRAANTLWAQLERLPEGDADGPVLRRRAATHVEKGTRLQDLAAALSGRLDPPEEPAPAPRPRHDFYRSTSLVPAAEAGKTQRRGGRTYVVPPPGDESDEDEEELTALVRHVRRLEAGEEPLPGDKSADLPGTLADAALDTLDHPQWAAYRRSHKARAPQAVHHTAVVL